MQEDLALRRNPATGRFTFDWDSAGDLRFDETATYPVLSTLYTHKGQYYFDRDGTQGTDLYTVRKDQMTTASQLIAYAQDGGDQCRAEGIIQAFSADASRLRSGAYELVPRWDVDGQSGRSAALRF